ncbi:MAG TPA: FtsX-like permease family protein [Dehalococcoidia bacterium]|nr:FtsX-like permease family protein [Dehalococcoidia bacterium]
MNELFGIPMGVLAVALPAAFGAVLGLIGILALRQPVLFRLSARYVARRAGRAALIVTGLMLATAIIAAALTTGDTMRHTIRSEVLTGLGNIDEVISTQEESDVEATGESAQLRYLDGGDFAPVRESALATGLVDGVTAAISETVGVQDLNTRRNEPRVHLAAMDPAYMEGFGQIRNVSGGTLSLSDLATDEAYLNSEAARELEASVDDRLAVYTGGAPRELRVKAVMDYDGGGADSAMMMTLAGAQQLLGKEGQIKHIFISNNGDAVSGARHTDGVIAGVQPTLERLGLFIEPTKRDDLKEADDAGGAFASFFMIFGTFSIIAGIMLIFLIFVMLAAERKSEMGISRAVGAERRHLIEIFTFEGMLYDLAAAAVGAVLGIAVGYGMVFVMARAVGVFGVEIRHDLQPRSVVVAYTLGVLITFAVVTVSAWRVSVLNIVSAIRNLPEPIARVGGRGSLVLFAILLLLAALMVAAGISGKAWTPFYIGGSLAIAALVPLMRWLRIPDRLAYTVPGLIIIVWSLLPMDVFEAFLPQMSADFSAFVTGGVVVVLGGTWVVMYNSDRALAAALGVFGRIKYLAPVLKTAISYPLTNRFRTGMTLAMFTLVVFTLVVGATTTNAFTEAWNNEEAWGGGFDIRATTVRVNPIPDIEAAIAESGTLDPADFGSIGNQSLLNLEVRQVSSSNAEFAAYAVRGLDHSFLTSNTYGFGAMAEGYTSARQVWQAVRDSPGLAVVDALPAPHRQDYGFEAGAVDFQLEGFYVDDGTFDPIPLEVRDPQTGKTVPLTIIGVLKDAAPWFMIGVSTSQGLVAQQFPEQATPSMHFFDLGEGVDAERTANALESAFLENGTEAEVLKDELAEAIGANRTFIYVIQGFLGLGLIVGVAALAVISARSVVERRHEIGVMRSIGFERSMVQLSFLLESSMIALVGILLGSVLGLAIAYNVIRDTADQPSWDNITFAVPWTNLLIVYAIVYGAALLAAFFPARQASRVYPAAALRYE